MRPAFSCIEMMKQRCTNRKAGVSGPWIVGLLTILIGTTLVVTYARSEVYSDRIVAVVNGDVILQSDIDKQKKPLIRSITNLNLGVVPPGKWPTERDFLDELVVVKLLDQEATRKGINPNEKSVEAAIDMIRKRNNLSQERFVLFLAASGLNYADFRDLLKRKIKLEGLIGGEVTKKVPFSEEDGQLFFKKHGSEEIERRWKELHEDKTPAQPPPRKFEPDIPTHEDVFEGGKVRLRMLTLKLPKDKNRAAMAKVENTAKTIAEEIMTGVDFGTLAKRYSQDPLKDKGGDLGFMTYQEMRPEWQRMVRRMKKGQVLGPVKSNEAILMFYLDDERGRKAKKVPIPEDIRRRLLEQKKKAYEEQMEAQARRRNKPGASEETPPETKPNASAKPSTAKDKKEEPSGILSPQEMEEYKKVRDKALAIVRTEMIQARMKEWIEELKKQSIIDVKL